VPDESASDAGYTVRDERIGPDVGCERRTFPGRSPWRGGSDATTADDLGQVMVETDTLLGSLTDQCGVLPPGDPQQDATVGLTRRRARLTPVSEGVSKGQARCRFTGAVVAHVVNKRLVIGRRFGEWR